MKNKLLLLIMISLLSPTLLFSQQFIYAKSVGGAELDAVSDMAVDASGNIYITGIFGKKADFDPGADSAFLTAAKGKAYFAKYDANGNYIWAKGIGHENGGTETRGIAVDNQGNVYLTGSFRSSGDFDPGPDSVILEDKSYITGSGGNGSPFIAKYDANGNYQWAIAIGNGSINGFDAGNDIITDAAGNVYACGFFGGKADFDPGPDTAELSSASIDAFFAKYSGDGKYQFAKHITGGSSERATTIRLDNSGNILLSGIFTSIPADFDPGEGKTELSAQGANDLFIAKYDPSGNYQFARAIGGAGSTVEATDFFVDVASNSYLAGYIKDATADFDPGADVYKIAYSDAEDIFFAKYSTDGQLVYANGIGFTKFDRAEGLAVDGNGNMYITGSFQFTVDFDPGPDTNSVSNSSDRNIFLAKYDASGKYLWAKRIGDKGGEEAEAIALSPLTGDIVLAGRFSLTEDFDISEAKAELKSKGSEDIFIAQYDPDIVIGSPFYESSGIIISIYPNPSAEAITICIKKSNNQDASLYIVNMLGETVYQHPINGDQSLAINGFSKGIYLVKLVRVGTAGTVKMIIN